MAITRLSGGTSPANGSDPRTFPAIFNAAATDIEAAEAAITAIEANDFVTTARIDDGAVTAPKLANTAGAVMVFDDDTARTTAIPTPAEGMVTYLKDTNLVEAYTGAAFEAVSQPGILQVVSVTKTDTFSTSSTSFVDVTGFAATITPTSATSKILVLVNAQGRMNNTAGAMTRLVRDSTDIYIGDTAGSRTRASSLGFVGGGGVMHQSSTFLDSPSSTSSTTYKVMVRVTAQTFQLNAASDDGDSAPNGRGASSITLMEVAG